MLNYKQLKTKLNQCLEQNNMRHSEQRYIILKALWEESGKHLSAEEIYDRVKQDEDIGIATVYRTLRLLTDCKICKEFKFDQNVSRYEITYGKKHHDHLICIKCGKYIEVMNQDIEIIQKQIAEDNDFILQSHKMELYGLCKDCQE
ncbi:MAG TPA: Fur family transcriptional regulator [bacterium]|nr:Fur family transcriptional regulator [bacterium]